MLPPTTSWPPNFFTPRRRPAESRPLRELPPAFLCAISNYLLLLRVVGLGGLFGGRLLGRRLFVRGLRTGAVLDGGRLLGLGFLLHLDALGGLDALCLVRGGSGRGGLFNLGSGFLLGSSLLFRLGVTDREDAQQRHLLAVTG